MDINYATIGVMMATNIKNIANLINHLIIIALPHPNFARIILNNQFSVIANVVNDLITFQHYQKQYLSSSAPFLQVKLAILSFFHKSQ